MADHRAIALRDDDIVRQIAPTREALHAGISEVYDLGKGRFATLDPTVIDNDTGEILERRFFVALIEDRETRSQRQNRFYWGGVLRQISEQATIEGRRYAVEAWHELFKRQFAGYEIVRVPVAGRKGLTTYRRLRSTTSLSVKEMSEYLDQVLAMAVTDLNVEFSLDPAEREAVRWKPKKRKQAAQAEGATA